MPPPSSKDPLMPAPRPSQPHRSPATRRAAGAAAVVVLGIAAFSAIVGLIGTPWAGWSADLPQAPFISTKLHAEGAATWDEGHVRTTKRTKPHEVRKRKAEKIKVPETSKSGDVEILIDVDDFDGTVDDIDDANDERSDPPFCIAAASGDCDDADKSLSGTMHYVSDSKTDYLIDELHFIAIPYIIGESLGVADELVAVFDVCGASDVKIDDAVVTIQADSSAIMYEVSGTPTADSCSGLFTCALKLMDDVGADFTLVMSVKLVPVAQAEGGVVYVDSTTLTLPAITLLDDVLLLRDSSDTADGGFGPSFFVKSKYMWKAGKWNPKVEYGGSVGFTFCAEPPEVPGFELGGSSSDAGCTSGKDEDGTVAPLTGTWKTVDATASIQYSMDASTGVVDPTTQLYFYGHLIGWWDNFFGFPMIHLSDVELGVRVKRSGGDWQKLTGLSGGNPDWIELGATVCIGSFAKCEAGNHDRTITAVAYGGNAPADVTKTYILLMLDGFTIHDIFKVLADTILDEFDDWAEALPSVILDSGITAINQDCTDEMISDPGAYPECFARFSAAYVEQKITTSGTTITVPQGYSSSGRLTIMGYSIDYVAEITTTRFYTYVEMEKMEIGNVVSICADEGCSSGPKFLMDFNISPATTTLQIDGYVSVDVLSLSHSVSVLLTESGAKIEVTHDIYGLYQSSIELSWSWTLTDLYFKASVEAASIADIQASVLASIKTVTEAAAAIKDQVVTDYEDAVDDIDNVCKALKNKGYISSSEKSTCKAFSDAIQAVMKAYIVVAKNVLSAAVDSIADLISAAVNSKDEDEFISITSIEFSGELSTSSSSASVSAGIEFNYFGNTGSISATIDATDVAGVIWDKIQEVWDKIADLASSVGKQAEAVANVLDDALGDAYKQFLKAIDPSAAVEEATEWASNAYSSLDTAASSAVESITGSFSSRRRRRRRTCTYNTPPTQVPSNDWYNPPESGRTYSSVLSSSRRRSYYAQNSVLNAVPEGYDLGYWQPSSCDSAQDCGQWMQMDLGSTMTVNGVVIQDRADAVQYVQTFTVQYSTDNSNWEYATTKIAGQGECAALSQGYNSECTTSEEIAGVTPCARLWGSTCVDDDQEYYDGYGEGGTTFDGLTESIVGSNDGDSAAAASTGSIVINTFSSAVEARYIRINVLTYSHSPSMRAAVLCTGSSCNADGGR